MTREEVIKLLAYIKALYPQFANDVSNNDNELIIRAWLTQLQTYQAYYVMCALNMCIKENNTPYAPSISQILYHIEREPMFLLEKYHNNIFPKTFDVKEIERTNNKRLAYTNTDNVISASELDKKIKKLMEQ